MRKSTMDIFKKTWKYISGKRGLTFIAYCSFSLVSDVWGRSQNASIALRQSCGIVLGCFLICPMVLRAMQSTMICRKQNRINNIERHKKLVFDYSPITGTKQELIVEYHGVRSFSRRYRQELCKNQLEFWQNKVCKNRELTLISEQQKTEHTSRAAQPLMKPLTYTPFSAINRQFLPATQNASCSCILATPLSTGNIKQSRKGQHKHRIPIEGNYRQRKYCSGSHSSAVQLHYSSRFSTSTQTENSYRSAFLSAPCF